MPAANLNNTRFPSTTEVLIVGAGPSGLALAIALQQSGVDHVLVDKLQQGLNTSRAGVIHSHTLEMLDRLGVAQSLAAAGLHVKDFCVRDRDHALVRIGFEALPSPHPYLLMLPQDQTETILTERLAALGGGIHRGVTATAVHQSPAGTTVTLSSPSGESAVKARYVVGADGMHSLVRTAAGAQFEGSAYAESFILADARMDWCFGTGEVSFFFSPDGLVVVAPLPGGRFRVVATAENAPEHPTLDFVQALMDARGPRSRTAVTEVLWSSRFRVHHRVARSYRNGPLFLMGDAAHVHSPAGGQGMNTGLVDAVVLGHLLARAIRSGDDAVLDQYHQLRRPAALEVLALSGRLTRIATVRGPFGQFLRNAALSFINTFPPARKKLMMSLSGLSRKALAELPADQHPVPTNNLHLQAEKGGRV